MSGAHILSLSATIWKPEHCEKTGCANKHKNTEARIFLNSIVIAVVGPNIE